MPLVENGQPEEIKLPNWGDFRLSMMGDATYQRVSDRSKNRLAVNRLESMFTAQIENWQVACFLWGQMVSACLEEIRPNEVEVEEWTAITKDTNIPIEFNSLGYPSPKPEGKNI